MAIDWLVRECHWWTPAWLICRHPRIKLPPVRRSWRVVEFRSVVPWQQRPTASVSGEIIMLVICTFVWLFLSMRHAAYCIRTHPGGTRWPNQFRDTTPLWKSAKRCVFVHYRLAEFCFFFVRRLVVEFRRVVLWQQQPNTSVSSAMIVLVVYLLLRPFVSVHNAAYCIRTHPGGTPWPNQFNDTKPQQQPAKRCVFVHYRPADFFVFVRRLCCDIENNSFSAVNAADPRDHSSINGTFEEVRNHAPELQPIDWFVSATGGHWQDL